MSIAIKLCVMNYFCVSWHSQDMGAKSDVPMVGFQNLYCFVTTVQFKQTEWGDYVVN